MNISIFDTTITSYNLGNEIIMSSINSNINEMFPNSFIFKLPYYELTEHTVSHIIKSQLLFFGGTNSLCPEIEKYRQWGITKDNYKYIKNFVLFGLGWFQYSDKISSYTKNILQNILKNDYIHSVRDEYTKNKLESIGISNVVNTGCPTLWNINQYNIKPTKNDKVIFTLTDYNEDYIKDSELIRILKRNYEEVFFFPQGSGDIAYIKKLDSSFNEKNIIFPKIENYDNVLSNNNIDYVGTRLHAGIYALQKNRRAIILSVDNRATEMGKDFNLPVIERSDIDNLSSQICGDYTLNIKIPHESILTWKNQFHDTKMIIERFERNKYQPEVSTLKYLKSNISNKLQNVITKNYFNPSCLGIFTNPFYFARKGLSDNIKQLAPKIYGRCLDVGCGSKPYQLYYTNVTEYIGMEHEASKERYSSAQVEYFYDGVTYPFKDESFDAVISSQVLEHVPNPVVQIQEMYRILKPKGKILISVPLTWDEHEQPYDFYRFTTFGLINLFEENGFEVIKVQKSVSGIVCVFQLMNAYLHKITQRFRKTWKRDLIITLLLNTPCTLVGLVLAKILPNNEDLYLDNIVLVQKKDK